MLATPGPTGALGSASPGRALSAIAASAGTAPGGFGVSASSVIPSNASSAEELRGTMRSAERLIASRRGQEYCGKAWEDEDKENSAFFLNCKRQASKEEDAAKPKLHCLIGHQGGLHGMMARDPPGSPGPHANLARWTSTEEASLDEFSVEEDELHRQLLRQRPDEAGLFRRVATGRYVYRDDQVVHISILQSTFVVTPADGKDTPLDTFLKTGGARPDLDEALLGANGSRDAPRAHGLTEPRRGRLDSGADGAQPHPSAAQQVPPIRQSSSPRMARSARRPTPTKVPVQKEAPRWTSPGRGGGPRSRTPSAGSSRASVAGTSVAPPWKPPTTEAGGSVTSRRSGVVGGA